MRQRVRDRFCERLHGDRVLEVGCGPGTDAAAFAARGLRVTASDYAEDFVRVVRERYPQLDVRQMDMSRPDLPAQSFDGIYGFACFIHLPRTLSGRALSGLGELLVPGGLLGLVLVESEKGIREYTIEGWGGDPAVSMLFTCYTQPEIGQRLLAVGFAEVCFQPVRSPVYDEMPRLLERGIRAYQVFARRPLLSSG